MPPVVKASRFHAAAILAAAILAAPAARAEHPWSDYSEMRQLSLPFRIAKAELDGPHVVVTVGPDNMRIVLPPLAELERRGVPRDALKVGERLVLFAYGHKTKRDEARAYEMIVGEKEIKLR